jgi:hypothetical protein
MTTRYAGRKVLGTQEVKSIGVMWGPRALSNASGSEHSRLKKLMHPTFSVSADYYTFAYTDNHFSLSLFVHCDSSDALWRWCVEHSNC